MIKTFADKRTAAIFLGRRVKNFSVEIQVSARVKMLMLDNSISVEDLRSPPGNRLEALKGDRKGQHSIRVNQQWRICFKWVDGDAHDVELVDYH